MKRGFETPHNSTRHVPDIKRYGQKSPGIIHPTHNLVLKPWMPKTAITEQVMCGIHSFFDRYTFHWDTRLD